MELRWIEDGRTELIPATELSTTATRDDGVLWVNVDHTEADEMARLADLFGLHPMAVQECHMRTPVPKVHVYTDHTFVSFNGLARGTDGELHFQPVKVFAFNKRLLTVLGPAHEALTAEAVHKELAAIGRRVDSGRLRPASAQELTHALTVETLRSQEELVGTLASRIAQLEQVVMHCDPVRSDHLLEELFSLRHDLQTIRTNAAQNRELHARLIESLGSHADASLLNDLRQGFAHLTAASDLERDYLQDMLDLFQTRTSNELNRFVRRITAWGAIGIAGTLIAGIYGMNFKNMPELAWTYGYPLALGLIVLVGILLGIVFHRRGWL